MMKRLLTTLVFSCLIGVPAMAGKVGLAESASDFRLGGIEVQSGVSTLVATGDIMESGIEPVLMQSEMGSLMLGGASRANVRDVNSIELEEGAMAVSLNRDDVDLQVGGLELSTLPHDTDAAQRALAVKRDGDAVMVWSLNQPVAVTSNGEQIAVVGANDAVTFVPKNGSFVMGMPMMQAETGQVFDPTMPEEDEDDKGFFWRFWGSTVGSSAAVSAAAVGGAVVVVVGGGAAATDNLPGQSDDDDSSDDGGDDGEDEFFPPPPSSPTFP